MNAPAQSASAILMVRPCRFYPNPETAEDNAFQAAADHELPKLTLNAREEFQRAVETLRDAGVRVRVFDDTPEPDKPDAIFPNNWISTHHDGRVALFPMYSKLRRRERRRDVIDALRNHYRITEVVDYSTCEEQGMYLEGTGSLVLDHTQKIAYVSLSKRSHPVLVRRFAEEFGYRPVTFTSVDRNGQPIYHTNVMMCVGTNFALIGLNCIPDETERTNVRTALERSGKELIELSPEQVDNFAGNAIELHNESGEKLLVISARALAVFTPGQSALLKRHVRVVPLSLPTIELGGGSARCMIATIHLPAR